MDCKFSDKYIHVLPLISFARMNFSEQYHIEDEARIVMRSPFQPKHTNDSMFSKDLATSHKKTVTICLHRARCLTTDIIMCKDQREN